jgi:hypothetical protein
MVKATWTKEEIDKVVHKVYSTKHGREKHLDAILKMAEDTEKITLTNVVRGMYNSRSSIDHFMSVLLELDNL